MQFQKDNKPVIIKEYRKTRRRFRGGIQLPDPSENRFFQFAGRYSLIFHAILSCILIFVIEWISRRSLSGAVSFLTGSPLVFLYNAFLIFVTLLFPYIFRRRALFRIIISVFWLILGIINGCVLASRVTPFNFTDLKLVGDLLAMKDSQYFTVAEGILVIVALIILVVFLIFFAVKGPKYNGKIHRIRNAVIFAAAVAATPFITKAAINNGILAGYFGNLAQGYSDYGFVYSFTASAADTGMREPSDYSNRKIQSILDSVHVSKTELNEDEMPNIIFVQLESLVDPEEVRFLNLSSDPIPNLRHLQENYTTGYLTVPVVGAGTVNTEFEVLTGMSIQYFGLGEYPYKTVLKNRSCESAADDLAQIGYSTHALHNNGGNFYSRAQVFSNMGFDDYTSKELMNIQDYNEIKSWPADSILLSETDKILNSTPDQKDFLYTITVQSHGSYPDYKVFENPAIRVSCDGKTTEQQNQWEYYVNEVHEVDTFVGNLIHQLSQRKEKTIVVLYGDHLPTMGLSDSDMKSGDIYKTRYYTWNNFGLEKNDSDLAAYQLMAYITDQIGIHEGTIFRYHQSALNNKTTDQKSYMNNLKLLQYDLLYANRYAYGGIEKYPASDMKMGVQEVRATRCYPDFNNTKLIIDGQNFTPWSIVYVNDNPTDTEFISATQLQINLDDIKDNDTLTVNQVGSSDTIFRSSNTLTYHEEDAAAPGNESDKTESQQPDTEGNDTQPVQTDQQ